MILRSLLKFDQIFPTVSKFLCFEEKYFFTMINSHVIPCQLEKKFEVI